MKKTVLAVLILTLASLGSAEGGPVNFAWDPSTDSTLRGYLISYGPAPGQYTSTIDVGNVTSYSFSPPDPTIRYYLAVRVVRTDGVTSPYSNEVVTTPALKVTALSANRTSPQPVGTSITFSATASGGFTPYQFKWWVADGTTSTVGQQWSASNTFVTTPTSPSASYAITVWARNGSSVADAADSAAAILSMAFVISPPGTNQAPAVNAGADRTITLPGSTTLTGAVADDGLPTPPGAVTLTWTRTSGPGTVTFSAPGAATTTASFSVAGAYVLRLTALDGALSGIDEVAVTVNATAPPPSSPVAAYAFSEGAGATVADASGNGHTGTISGASWIAGGKFDKGLSFDGVNDWVTIAHSTLLSLTTGMTLEAWVYPTANGGGAWREVVIKEQTGNQVFNLYANDSTNVPEVQAFTAAQPGTLNRLGGPSQLPLNTWTHLATTYDGTTLRLFANGVQVGSTAVTGALLTSTGSVRIGGNSIWGEFFQGNIDEVRIYDRALTAAQILTDMNTPIAGALANQAPAVSAGVDQTITLPNGATMSGTVTDDGQPAPPGAVTRSWTRVSGTGTVAFSAPTAATTTATFSAAGTYVLRLTGSDSVLSATDDVTVTVSAANQAPAVNAGADQTITLPSVATMSGTVTDDGQPAPPGAVTRSWTRVSGTGTVAFSAPTAATTTATFSAAGTYVLRLTGSDSVLSATDDVTVTVSAANQAPAVNAGADQTITLPSVATMSGTVTDDGQPAPPGAVTRSWTRVSGPGTVTFSAPTAATTTATFSAAGTQVLRLTGSDSVLSATDDVIVTVGAANQAPAVNAGVDQAITLPTGATMSGTVTDDGQPASPGAVTLTWTRVSGPGTVTFSAPTAATTTATFSAAGTQVLRLTASDGALSRTDDVTVTVKANPPPTAPGALTATALLPGQLSLSWTASTDANGIKEYRIQRCQGVGCSTFTLIKTVAGTTTTYVNTGLAASTSYRYRIRAVDAAGKSGPFSNTVTAATLP